MRVLIIGKTGQVGSELARVPWPNAFQVTQLGRAECDLTQPELLRDAVNAALPDLVVNVAAYTAVDKAESEPALAEAVNANGPAELAHLCAERNSVLIHLSTDYVFDGAKEAAYVEQDPINPLSVYGQNKAAGERTIREMLERHIILRTSWVFSSYGSNFVKTILRLTREKPELRVVDDQHGKPTAARDIAQAIVAIAARIRDGASGWGTYHFAGDPAVSWFDFAKAIVAENAHRDGKNIPVHPIGTADFPTAAKRPMNSVLGCAKIQKVFGVAAPDWRDGLANVIEELNSV